jgi:hypothetical protein
MLAEVPHRAEQQLRELPSTYDVLRALHGE